MQRITTSTKAVDLFGAGKHGFKDGDLPNGILPTDFNADWCNLVQEEIARAVEGAGIVLDGAVRNQLSLAIAAMIAAAAPPIAQGQCRLSKSGANLILLPYKGNRLMVNGVLCTIPDAGVTLAPPAVASTTYNIYAVATAGVVTSLEQSATAHVPDTAAGANKGVEIKTGDPTRSLVGMARTTSGNAWADTSAQRFVLSWFNRAARIGTGAFTTNKTTTSASYVELGTEIRCEFLTWADDAVRLDSSTICYNPALSNAVFTGVALDGAVPEDGVTNTTAAVNGQIRSGGNPSIDKYVAEGYHYVTLVGKSPAGDACVWIGAATAPDRCTLRVTVKG